MDTAYYISISADEAGQRLDNYLFWRLKGVPKSHIYRIIRGGEVRVNKKRAKINQKLISGDQVRIPPMKKVNTEKSHIEVSQSLEKHLLDAIVFENELLLVINKPAGLAVHGGSGLSLGLIEALRKIRQDLFYLELVHRLDKDTSGCLVLAKKRSALRAIHLLLQERKVKKVYWALLLNVWQGRQLVEVNFPLEKNTLQSGQRIVQITDAGKASQTRFKLIENFVNSCWVEAVPKTGRTHQIRVHAAKLGHPIISDPKYAKREDFKHLPINKSRLYLHARSFNMILHGQEYLFTVEPDKEFTGTIERLRSLEYQ